MITCIATLDAFFVRISSYELRVRSRVRGRGYSRTLVFGARAHTYCTRAVPFLAFDYSR